MDFTVLQNKIEELKQFVSDLDKPKKNVVTQYPSSENTEIEINHEWAASLYPSEEQGNSYEGEKVSGHKASLFLAYSSGTWYDEGGNRVSGYFYFKPNNE